MQDLRKIKRKKFVKLNLGSFIISQMGLLNSINNIKKMKIRINSDASSNHKHHSRKQANKAKESSVETDDGSVDFHLEIAKKINNVISDNGKKEKTVESGSLFQKKTEPSPQDIVELRSLLHKKPEIPQFLTEEETENIIIKTCYKEKLFEKNLPAEVYHDSKRPKDTSSLKNNENVKNNEFLGWMSDKHNKTSVKSAKIFPHIKVKKEKEQDTSNNHEKEISSSKKTESATEDKESEEKNDYTLTEGDFLKIKKKKNSLTKKEEWTEKKEEEIKREIESLKSEKELLKKQGKELKKEEKQKKKERKLEAVNILKEKKEAEKQKRLEENQKLKEERINELELRKKANEKAKKEEKLKKKNLKEELIKELELKKKTKEEEKRKKIEEKKTLKEEEMKKEKFKGEKEKVAVIEKVKEEGEKIKDETGETVKEFDNLILDEKKTGKEITFLDKDVEKIIPVIDILLEKLPEDVIEEFARSDDFALYEKVVRKYKNK